MVVLRLAASASRASSGGRLLGREEVTVDMAR